MSLRCPALPSLCWHHGGTPSEHTQGVLLAAGCIPPVAPWVWKCVVSGWVECKVCREWVAVHVCMVDRWRVKGHTCSQQHPLALSLAMSIIKPYPHAITLNSYHSNQPHPHCKASYHDNLNIVGHCLLYSDRSQKIIMWVTWLDLRSLIGGLNWWQSEALL